MTPPGANASAPLAGAVFCPLVGYRPPPRVRYPRASARDTAGAELSKLHAASVSGAPGARRCRRGTEVDAVIGQGGPAHLCRWAWSHTWRLRIMFRDLSQVVCVV